ncbi:hypothetical protein SISSUDRAFT_458178 [Sistotremastrum suecicum HHB10207 ss-3]|uniref:Uncharacterized protein n=1 Tax=Sistotremastrum suecicum HHB10207 ss-3 TaxID=1314776 RepID=A0A165Y7D3_9AGAM|nr:hypothetical protein SISSUDRAFT_458178 [Sistotremastrum suecicum HHB10207 ss-3]
MPTTEGYFHHLPATDPPRETDSAISPRSPYQEPFVTEHQPIPHRQVHQDHHSPHHLTGMGPQPTEDQGPHLQPMHYSEEEIVDDQGRQVVHTRTVSWGEYDTGAWTDNHNNMYQDQTYYPPHHRGTDHQVSPLEDRRQDTLSAEGQMDPRSPSTLPHSYTATPPPDPTYMSEEMVQYTHDLGPDDRGLVREESHDPRVVDYQSWRSSMREETKMPMEKMISSYHPIQAAAHSPISPIETAGSYDYQSLEIQHQLQSMIMTHTYHQHHLPHFQRPPVQAIHQTYPVDPYMNGSASVDRTHEYQRLPDGLVQVQVLGHRPLLPMRLDNSSPHPLTPGVDYPHTPHPHLQRPQEYGTYQWSHHTYPDVAPSPVQLEGVHRLQENSNAVHPPLASAFN